MKQHIQIGQPRSSPDRHLTRRVINMQDAVQVLKADHAPVRGSS
jgi:hypothetical protein